MDPVPDRVETLLGQTEVTGIDFVFVHASQTTLDVFFILEPDLVDPSLVGSIASDAVHITDTERGIRVPVTVAGWVVVDGRQVLRLTVAAPGGFAMHTLRIDDARMDVYFNDIAFSFKAVCPSRLDCASPPHLCPPEDSADFEVDYLARDFQSLRRALLDFAARRHPTWQDRLEADVGMMWVELAAAVGDELAYIQDRWGREGHWETAVQRRSVRAHARLVDYELDDGAASSTWLDLTVTPGGGTVTVEKGTAVRSSDGAVVFEVGRGLHDSNAGYAVNDARNELTPHIWDEDDTCLACGATSVHVSGHHAADLAFDDFPPGRPAGTWMLLRTDPESAAIPARALPVRVVEVADDTDRVRMLDVTRLRWEAEQATPYELDLNVLVVRANLVPATAGETATALFAAGPAPAGFGGEPTVERAGPDGAVCHRFTLPGSEERTLAWTVAPEGGARPEVLLDELDETGLVLAVPEWTWRRSLVGTNSSLPIDSHFTLEDGAWRRIAGFRTPGGEVVERDLASASGVTLRFGDGEFGSVPADGTRFRATFRLAGGSRDDVAANTLTDLVSNPGGLIDAVTNPVPATGGRDPQPLGDARVDAPDAFRAVTFRAVRPEDYAEAVERLEWVQRAGASLRWTGSWLTVFAAADPRDAVGLSATQERELAEQLDRFRQAGREAWGRPPRYADLDLELKVCVGRNAYAGDVAADVLEALVGHPEPCTGQRSDGFLHPDRFTFGTPLYRSALEAAVQDVPGVRAVEDLRIRRRGLFDWRAFAELVFRVAPDEVIRVEHDRLHPDRGSLRLEFEGGL